MKTAKFSLIVVILALAVFAGYSQKGIEDGSKYGHGEDSVLCIRNYSLYSEYYKQKNYEDALPYWRMVFNDCPKVSKNIYQHGANMYKFYIIQEGICAVTKTNTSNGKEVTIAHLHQGNSFGEEALIKQCYTSRIV